MPKLAAALLFVSCATLQPAKPPPVLAPVQTGSLNVQFIGTKPEDAELFVCGFLDLNADPDRETLSCIDYVLFMKQLQEMQ